MRNLRALTIIGVALTLVFASGISAAAGDLDPSFDGDGKVATDFGAADVAGGVAVQADGKIVAAGYSENPNDNASDFVLARYNADGALDPGFGSAGKVRTVFGPSSEDAAFAVAVQPDGKIVAGGGSYTPDPDSSTDFALARYNSDGSLDSTFGGGTGKVLTNLLRTEFATSVAIQPDGKIVAAGMTRRPGRVSPRDFDFAVVRYNTDGSLDTSFSGDGYDIIAFTASYDAPSSVLVQPNGKIVLAGVRDASDPNTSRQVLVRYNGDGSLDGSFNRTGVVEGQDPGGWASSVALQTDGKLVVGGGSVTRYNADGSVDASFGENGKAVLAGQAGARIVLVQPNGKLVVAGAFYSPDGGDFLVAKLRSNGSRDTTFGDGGQMHTDFGTNSYDELNAAVLQSNRRIVVAGGAYTGPGASDFALARFQNPPPCLVPKVRGQKLRRAKASIRKANCKVGKITRRPSKRVKKARVLSQSQRVGAELRNGTRVNLVVGKGRRP
jgi:uncharacterized delta-60 repeat protein